MARLTLITGGVASGKSSFALQEAQKLKSKKVLFLATARPMDAEMKKKIARHKEERPKSWVTVEGKNERLSQIVLEATADVVILDCLTLFVADSLKDAEMRTERLLDALVLNKKIKKIFVVTNEVGWGVVPTSKSGRLFREVLGRVNKCFAVKADSVVLVVAGIPFRA